MHRLNAQFAELARPPRRRVHRGLAFVFIVVHLVIALITLPIRAAFPMGPKDSIEGYFVHVPSDASVEERDVVMVNSIVPVGVGYLPIIRELNGRPVPRHTRALAPGWFPVSVHRRDERTLVIRPAYGFIVSPGDELVRDERNPMFVGQRVELTGMTVEVTALTEDGWPAEAVFQFAVTLEDPSLIWLQFKHGELVPFTPPAIGETIELPAGVPEFLTKLAAWGRT